MKGRSLLFIGLGVIVAAAVVGGLLIGTGGSDTKKPKAPAGFITFHDNTTALSIGYPPSWSKLTPPDPQVRLLVSAGGPSGLDSLLVRVQPTEAVVGSSPTNVAALKAVTDAIVSPSTVLQNRSLTLNGMPAIYYLYTFTDPATAQQLVHAHYFVFRGHNMISLVFQAVTDDFAALAATFDKVAASLQVDAVTPSAPPTS